MMPRASHKDSCAGWCQPSTPSKFLVELLITWRKQVLLPHLCQCPLKPGLESQTTLQSKIWEMNTSSGERTPMKATNSIFFKQQMACSSNGTQDSIAPSASLSMTHMPAPAITLLLQTIQTGTTTPRTSTRQESCTSGLERTFGLPDGQPDANHADQMSFCPMEPEVTYNATQMVRTTLTPTHHYKNIRMLIETTATVCQETDNQESPTGSPKI